MRIKCLFTYQQYMDAPAAITQGNDVIIAIDVLRATSSIITALANGAKAVYAVKEIAAALALKEKHPEAILVGERGGLIIDGFDCGNSPLEFGPQTVAGKTLISCTTNGTAAIEISAKAESRLFLGAIINSDAVALKTLQTLPGDILILCSGTEGKISMDDIIGAGSIIHRLLELAGPQTLDDGAKIAHLLYQRYAGNLLQALEEAVHGKKLTGVGRYEDLVYCAQENLVPYVPERQGDILR